MLLAGYKDGSTSPAMKEMTCLKRLGQAEEIANVALFMLSEEASYVTGCKMIGIRNVYNSC
jgi:NAD(P)-dependent dehydrogenase (short-subunit alcohol dehydrogenase family)